ncbi:MAG TPA: AAA family ATPase [Candidatus Sumerlaeota bacterium]|nr:AAA family ATPase [Candidatus Sumerlaeota bacterium]
MIGRIILENYMAHVRTVIEPAPGLTVLVGPNNCGKSAVVSALEQVLYNAHRGDFMVRHGEKEARITIETDDGHTVIWRRRGGAVAYIIDGQEISRIRSNVPEGVHRILRLAPVVTERGEYQIHLAPQKAPIFLINESETQAAAFLASSSDAERLMEMQRRHRLKTQNLKTEAQQLRGVSERLDAEITALDPVDSVRASFQDAEQNHAALQARINRAGLLGDLHKNLVVRTRERDILQNLKAAGAGLGAPPALSETRTLDTLLKNMGHIKRQVQIHCLTSQTLTGLNTAPPLQDTAQIQGLLDSLKQSRRAAAIMRESVNVMNRAAPPQELADTIPLETLRAEIAAAIHSRNAHAEEKNRIETEWHEAMDEARDFVTRNPRCPLCGSVIQPETLTEGGCAHD